MQLIWGDSLWHYQGRKSRMWRKESLSKDLSHIDRKRSFFKKHFCNALQESKHLFFPSWEVFKVQISIKCVQSCSSNTLFLQCCPERSLSVFQYLLGQICIWRIYWKQAGVMQLKHQSCLLYIAWVPKRC